jgi:hypothetical protein
MGWFSRKLTNFRMLLLAFCFDCYSMVKPATHGIFYQSPVWMMKVPGDACALPAMAMKPQKGSQPYVRLKLGRTLLPPASSRPTSVREARIGKRAFLKSRQCRRPKDSGDIKQSALVHI